MYVLDGRILLSLSNGFVFDSKLKIYLNFRAIIVFNIMYVYIVIINNYYFLVICGYVQNLIIKNMENN